MTAEPRLSVVVPASDAPPTLGRCLAALRAGSRAPDELIVAREAALPGAAAARNAGAERARGEVLVFVDADVEVHPDALARIEATLTEGRATAVFGAYDDAPAAPGAVSRFRNLLHHHVHREGAGAARTFWAGLGGIRAGAFRAAGGFDAERFPRASVEDVELGLRLDAAGERLLLDPAVQGRHLKAWTLASMVRTDVLRRGVPWVRLLAERRQASTALNLGWRHRASAACAVALAAAPALRRPRTTAAAAAGLVALNARFYALLARRGGPRLAAAGLPLHVLHHLCAAAALPLGLLAYLRDGWRR